MGAASLFVSWFACVHGLAAIDAGLHASGGVPAACFEVAQEGDACYLVLGGAADDREWHRAAFAVHVERRSPRRRCTGPARHDMHKRRDPRGR